MCFLVCVLYSLSLSEVEYDITSPNEDIPDTWYRMSGTPEPSCPNEESIIVPNSAPILLAVPAGYMLPPETVLCHPVSGETAVMYHLMALLLSACSSLCG